MTHSKPAPQTIVRIGGAIARSARVLTVDLSTGGRRLDSATFELLTPGQQKPGSELENLDFSTFAQAEVSISVKPPSGAEFPVHWGKVSGYTIRHDSGGEVFVVNSRQENHHFGNPLKNIPILKAGGAVVLPVQKPLVFNDEIDGQIFPNRSTKNDIAGRFTFVDPESLRTDNAAAYQGKTAKLWTLNEAASFLCRWLNFGEPYIKNPDAASLAVLPTDNKLLRNHPIKYGQHLPGCLEELLDPYGFSWYVELVGTERHIKFFRRGVGFLRTFAMQRPGEQIDMNKTNVESVNIGFDVTSRAFNAVEIQGDYKHYESTFELMPAWEADLDASTDDELSKDSEDWATNPKLARVWRDWVLNEAGDYDHAMYRVYPLHEVFGAGNNLVYNNRRKFLPCISLGDDGSPVGQTGGIIVEWWDAAAVPPQWRPLDEIESVEKHVEILDRECGIRFTGLVPPAQLRGQGLVGNYTQEVRGARVRVTATIISDERITKTLAAPASLIADKKELVLELPSRFKFRKIHKDSINYDAVNFSTLKSTEVNDSAAMGTLAEELLENWNQASIDGNVTLTGPFFDIQQALGDPLGGIFGRNVKFGTNVGGTKFPTIIGLRFDFMQQTTTVTLDTWQREIGSM